MAHANDYRKLFFVRDRCGYRNSFSFIHASSKREIEMMIESVIKKFFPEDEWEQEISMIHIIEVKPVNMKTLRKNLNKWLTEDE